MRADMTESIVEDAALSWLSELGYAVLHGLDIGPGERGEERASYKDVVLIDRLRSALAALNPDAPPPRLLSGELRVSDAKKLLEDVT